MPVFSVDAIAQVSSFGAVGGMVWCNVPDSRLMAFTGISSVGMAQQPRTDYTPPGMSVGVALPSCTLSVAGTFDAPFQVAVGSTVTARYTNLASQVTQENWMRVV